MTSPSEGVLREKSKMDKELEKRIEELSARCERQSMVTSTGFLTMAQQAEVTACWARRLDSVTLHMDGGNAACERKCAFFLPYWLDLADFDPAEHIRALQVTAFFGEPGHRDYMGAALGLGIRREWIGDFWVDGSTAHIFCLPTVERLLLDELKQVGRYTVKAASIPLADVPVPARKVKKVTFTVKSLRLDAVSAGMFGISRTTAAELIRAGAVTLDYVQCLHVDAPISEGSVISIRGRGKGAVTAVGGRSRKDRVFVETEICL